MATVKDLETVFSAEARLTPGEVRMVTRLLQDGGILPKVRRGYNRLGMPQITAEHCAAWLVGLAVTRRAGLRNVMEATQRVKRVLGLVPMKGDHTFGELLTNLIETYIEGTEKEYGIPLKFFIINDDEAPQAEVIFSRPKNERNKFLTAVFVTAEERAMTEEQRVAKALQGSVLSDAFVIGGEVLPKFRAVFGVDDGTVEDTAA